MENPASSGGRNFCDFVQTRRRILLRPVLHPSTRKRNKMSRKTRGGILPKRDVGSKRKLREIMPRPPHIIHRISTGDFSCFPQNFFRPLEKNFGRQSVFTQSSLKFTRSMLFACPVVSSTSIWTVFIWTSPSATTNFAGIESKNL